MLAQLGLEVMVYPSIHPSFQKAQDGPIATNQTLELDLFHRASSGSTPCDFICPDAQAPIRDYFAPGSRFCRSSITPRSRGPKIEAITIHEGSVAPAKGPAA